MTVIIPPIPFPNSYWVSPAKLLAGYYPGDLDTVKMEDKLKRLLWVGIRHIINLMEEDERKRYGDPFPSYENAIARYAKRTSIQVTCVRMSIKNLTAPTRGYMRDILNEIDNSIAQDRPVYVHCWGGKGRTGTVVGCYLAHQGYAHGENVFDLIQKLKPNDPDAYYPLPQTPQQRHMVVTWQDKEKRKNRAPRANQV